MSVPARIAGVPSLAQIATDRALLDSLPADALIHLRREVGYLREDLDAALARQVRRAETPDSGPGRAVRIDEAAKLFGMTTDFLYRNWRKLGGYRDADGHVKFPLSTIHRHITRNVPS